MKVIYWGRYIELHLLELLESLEVVTGTKVDYALVNESNPNRQIQAEQLIDSSGHNVIRLNRGHFFWRAFSLMKDDKEAVHLFLSFWGDKRLFLVILYGLALRRNVAVILEPYSESALGYMKEEKKCLSMVKVGLRKGVYSCCPPLFKLVSRGKPPCILAVSEIACRQLQRARFETRTIFPFGYFIKKKTQNRRAESHPSILRVVYSGSLLKVKGLDIAIKAVEEINTPKVRMSLDIYGPGDIKSILDHDIAGICYRGTYRLEDAQNVFCQYDLLLLPSRHDGWGLVVNEALMAGVPVILSDRVGAKVLVERSGAGRVFCNQNVEQLKAILCDIVDNQTSLLEMKANCLKVQAQITAQQGAVYLNTVLAHYFFDTGERPAPFMEV